MTYGRDYDFGAQDTAHLKALTEEQKTDYLQAMKLSMDSTEDQERYKREVLWVKERILECESSSDLILKAENLIDEDWLGPIDELGGNMYHMLAYGTALPEFEGSVEDLRISAVLIGFVMIAILQVCCPVAVVVSYVSDYGIEASKKPDWSKWEMSLEDWKEIGFTKFLSCIFIFVFCLNGLFYILEERNSWRKMDNMFAYIEEHTPQFTFRGECYLWLGAVINCWCVFWCCLAAGLAIGNCRSPKDAAFDALALLFLYNLDDIDGDLGFVSKDDWPGLRLGWIYEEMVKENFPEGLEPGEDPDDDQNTECMHNFIMMVFMVTSFLVCILCIVLPIFAAVTNFIDIVPED